MDKALEGEIRRRARGRCEYCLIAQAWCDSPFQIDHIVARKHGGATTAGNLAVSCYRCNLYKGPNIAGVDPDTGQVTRLFHPRRNSWDEHFAWLGAALRGRTPVGRTTISVLRINHPSYVAVRESLIEEGVFPPSPTKK